MAYAYICRACDHRDARHVLIDLDGPVTGDYRCTVRACECVVPQDHAYYTITESEWDTRYGPNEREWGRALGVTEEES